MGNPDWSSGFQMSEEYEGQDKVHFMLDRMDEAHKYSPYGKWYQRWIPFWCKHPVQQVRCTHGDEIHGRRGRRRVCMKCGRSLKGSLPIICFFTGEPHVGQLYSDVNDVNVRPSQ